MVLVVISFLQAPQSCHTIKSKNEEQFSYQIAHIQYIVELFGHWVVFHGHEDSIEDNADGNPQINKRVHDNELNNVL